MHCPICKSKETHYFAHKNNYIFHRCIACKTLFLLSTPSQKQLNAYYVKQFSYRDGLINEMVIRKRSQTILARIKRLAPSAKMLCDAGSGYGFFLDEANNAGYKTMGIEPSRYLANYAKRNYRVSTFVGELKDYANEEKKQFDVVTCIHVIEHVLDPKRFISLLSQLVKPGGILYIETPNSDSHLLYVEKERYTFLIPPEHLWLFSSESIKNILPRNTQTVFTNTYSYSEHFMGIVKQIINNCKSSLRAKHDYSEAISKRLPRRFTPRNDNTLRKNLSYFLFDRILAPLFTGLLNLYHKGSILELYIKKK